MLIKCLMKFHFNEVQLLNSFMYHAFGVVPKKSYQTQGHLDLLLCYLINSLVLCFAFRYVLHFELIFVKGVRYHLPSFLCLWTSNCFSTIHWKDCLFPLNCVCCLSKISWLLLCWSVSGLPVLVHCSVFHQQHPIWLL